MTKPLLIVNTNPLLNLVHPGRIITGAINRVPSLDMHAEGKGVNVARVLARLGHNVIVTGFAGGHSGAWLRDLIRAEGIEDGFLDTAAPVRVGFMASCGEDSHPTTVLPNGFPVTCDECAALKQRVEAWLPRVALVIISGSVPDPVAEPLYAELLQQCHEAGIFCWLDAHGPALRMALAGAFPPDLAKPNLEEYRQSEQWGKVPELHVTDGGNPTVAWIRDQGHWRVAPPPIHQVNPVGCGDCYLAGLAHGWSRGWPLERRLRFASAAGAANALRQDVAMITPEEIENLLDGVVVERIDAVKAIGKENA
jgi:1-phosphofructokinase family hexose kinase